MTQMLLFTLFLKTERKLNCSRGSDPWGSHSDLLWGFEKIKQRKWQFLDWLDHAIIHALMRSLRLRPQWPHPPSAHLPLELELPSLASKPTRILGLRDTWYLTAAARSNEQKQWREIHTLKIYVNCKLILICFYAQFSPLSTLFCSVYNELLCLRDQKYLV